MRAFYQVLINNGGRIVTAGSGRRSARCPSLESQVLQGEPREQIAEAAS